MSPTSAPVSWARGLEGVPGGVLAFAAMCLLGLLAIVCGVLFEIGRVRREGAGSGPAIAREQFGWRMASALVWSVALGLLAYGSSWGWPRHKLGLGLDGRGWLQVLGWAMLLILLGIVLLAHDLWRVKARTSAQETAFRASLSLLAQQEIENAARLRSDQPRSDEPRSEVSNSS